MPVSSHYIRLSFIQVKVDGDEHLHVRIHKTFQGEVTLHSVQEKKNSEDEIGYF